MTTDRTLYTIGHSSHSADDFLCLLRREGVNCVVDVRSQPQARYFPQFNQDKLADFLGRNGVYYLAFCDDFGPRRYDSLDESGQVDFERAMRSPRFLRAAARVERGLASGFGIALMCSEGDPYDCHRFPFLGRYFHERGVGVRHYLRDGRVATHAELQARMVRDYLQRGLVSGVTALFDAYTEAEQIADAYRVKNREIGFRI